MVHSKIEESSKNLLSVIKRESRSLENNLKERKVESRGSCYSPGR